MKTVALAIFPGVQSLDVAGPLDVFMEANGFIAEGRGYQLTLVAADRAPLRASNGLRISADVSFDEADGSYDLLLVAGGPGLPTADADPALTDWLAAMAPRAERYGSVCTGAFALGHAGLIDGRTVTTHWQNAALLAQRFPKARVAFDRIYSRDGALVTSAGVTAGIDLGLALVQEDHGPDVALAVAKRLVVVAQRQGGQSQFSPYLVPPTEPDSPIARVHVHVMSHLRDDHHVEVLADVAGMSARSFARTFKQDTGLTPADFVEGARIDAARNRLEGSTLPLKVVAFDCGFSSAEHMRQVFVRRLRLTPSQYRASFRTT
ncbi:MAG: AraC family transcriptional regulator [Tardiphaga sp.]|nr:AraC family transcriptional regulator [Tardiphaga sp.]